MRKTWSYSGRTSVSYPGKCIVAWPDDFFCVWKCENLWLPLKSVGAAGTQPFWMGGGNNINQASCYQNQSLLPPGPCTYAESAASLQGICFLMEFGQRQA